MPSDLLFGPGTSTQAMLAATSERAWVAAMLQFEAALAAAAGELGLIPKEAVEAISVKCGVDDYDIAQLGGEARRYANPAAPLVEALRSKVDKQAAQFVHLGATSQDVVDTAMMLIAQKGLVLVLEDLDRGAMAAARLADEHRSTLMPARTLMQQALPTSFGLRAAGWLTSIDEARAEVERVRYKRVALQFGGAAGTLASLTNRGLELRARLAELLGLPDTAIPWHTSRARVVEIGNALGVASGAGTLSAGAGAAASGVVAAAGVGVARGVVAAAGRATWAESAGCALAGAPLCFFGSYPGARDTIIDIILPSISGVRSMMPVPLSCSVT